MTITERLDTITAQLGKVLSILGEEAKASDTPKEDTKTIERNELDEECDSQRKAVMEWLASNSIALATTDFDGSSVLLKAKDLFIKIPRDVDTHFKLGVCYEAADIMAMLRKDWKEEA